MQIPLSEGFGMFSTQFAERWYGHSVSTVLTEHSCIRNAKSLEFQLRMTARNAEATCFDDLYDYRRL